MSLTARVGRVEQLHKCRRCGLSLTTLRANLAATLEVIRRTLPAAEAERVIEELKGIWLHT